MATSKKVTDLTAANSASSTDLLYIVTDVSGTPTSKKITANNFFNSNSSAKFATVTAANILANGGVVAANSVMISYNIAPTSNTDVPSGMANNTMWTDGNYIYVVANTASATQKVKKVALTSIT